MKTGIYKIENLINHHIYIGQSTDIERRWQAEKRVAFSENAHEYNYPLSRAFRKYGVENFSFEIIEECLSSDLNQREKYWIKYYNSFYDGYNQTLGGDGSTGGLPKQKIIGVIQDLLTTDMKHKEIAEKWNISIEMVQGVNTGRYWYQDNLNYPLQERCKQLKQQRGLGRTARYCPKCGAQISQKAILCVSCAREEQRKVIRPSREELKNLIRHTPFTSIAKQYSVSDNAIRKWCDYYNLPRQKSVIKKISDEEWLKV